MVLHRLRFARTRGLAQRRIAEGHMRCNGVRVMGRDHRIAVGDVLTMPMGRHVAVIEILALPGRRGPAAEAQACYRVLDAGGAFAIAGHKSPIAAAETEGKYRP